MDPNAKKTALRMIPYGLFVLTAAKGDRVSAGTVNWVTQASFEPPLVVVGVKTDSHGHPLIKESGAFALNVLGKGQQAMAYTFFKPADKQGQTISGEPFRAGKTGSPILTNTPGLRRVHGSRRRWRWAITPSSSARSSTPVSPRPRRDARTTPRSGSRTLATRSSTAAEPYFSLRSSHGPA